MVETPLLVVVEDPTLPPDRSVLPPRPALPILVLLPVLLLPPSPVEKLLLPPLPDDVVDKLELLAIVALELDEREEERLPLSFPTWYSRFARFSSSSSSSSPPALETVPSSGPVPPFFLPFFHLTLLPLPLPPLSPLPDSESSSVPVVVEPPTEPWDTHVHVNGGGGGGHGFVVVNGTLYCRTSI